MDFASTMVAQGALVEALVPPSEPIPTEESTRLRGLLVVSPLPFLLRSLLLKRKLLSQAHPKLKVLLLLLLLSNLPMIPSLPFPKP